MSSSISLMCILVLPPALITALFAFLLINKYLATRRRITKYENKIWSFVDEWGQDFCQQIINRNIAIGMTEAMVVAAWGRPSRIDQKKETTTYRQERWTYGQPRRGPGANYVIFRNGQVIETTKNFIVSPASPRINSTLSCLTVIFALLTMVACFISIGPLLTQSLSEPAAKPATANPTATRIIIRSGTVTKDLGQQSVDFGSDNQAHALLAFIEENPNKADYQISYQTPEDTVLFGCNFDKDVIVRIHQYSDGHGYTESWQGYILDRLNNAASGKGNLNDTPIGKQFGDKQEF